MAILGVVLVVFPENGISIGNTTIEFPTYRDFFSIKVDENQVNEKDLSEIFDSTVVISEIDSAVINHKLDSLHEYRKTIQITNIAKPALHRFFDALD
ncbi:MAG TPA: hypothetical protein PK649_11740, partial [Vicingus sp.]|nr:hypothetical protein [Vicingus sp.]